MKHYTYQTSGVCSRKIDIDVDGDTVIKVVFTGGCSGNTQGVAALVAGMNVDEAIARLEGIHCGPRPTSCPDQLSKALKACKAE
ncbi:MAG: TIGR03905 family TSCPD domain-containing protein [Ruminococcaceae bacterium]|nr:TIGR03905 family TSCPD domain-containing protein [Oscillospiraceae bacterium]